MLFQAMMLILYPPSNRLNITPERSDFHKIPQVIMPINTVVSCFLVNSLIFSTWRISMNLPFALQKIHAVSHAMLYPHHLQRYLPIDTHRIPVGIPTLMEYPMNPKNHPLSQIIIWLVVDLPLWKIWKSNGIKIPNILWKVIKFHGAKPPTRYFH